MDDRDRDLKTIFMVRFLGLITLLTLVTFLAVAGVAKIIAPTYDAGQVALLAAWPGGTLVALALLRLRQHRHAP